MLIDFYYIKSKYSLFGFKTEHTDEKNMIVQYHFFFSLLIECQVITLAARSIAAGLRVTRGCALQSQLDLIYVQPGWKTSL